ncbi:MAG TPA: glycine cleavage system aminomethyltransferase GcvT, partial [Bacteroidetes bacterium]|nr:glycine cleavage system aminomethyltransferase GcvT [Bacteroidota bacterium]
MKTTPLTDIHKEAGAKMVSFAGFLMPVEYSGIQDEHIAVRTKLGVFDVSHMGEIWIRGPKALDFLQWVTSNDVSALYDGKVQYSCFPNGQGGIVDDLLVYRFAEDEYLLVVNASNIGKDYNWLVERGNEMGLTAGKEIENVSDEVAQLA